MDCIIHTFQILHERYEALEFCSFYGQTLTLLVGRQEGHPACKKTEWWGTGVVICLERDAGLHMAQLMPLPLTDWFYLCGTGSPG